MIYAELTNENLTSYLSNNYAKNFKAPYTIYNNADETGEIKAGYRTRYCSIFNVVNEDDGYAFMMPHRLGFSRYGMTCYGSGRKELWNGSIFNPYTGKESYRRAVVEAMEKLYKGYEDKTRTRTYSSNISKFLE